VLTTLLSAEDPTGVAQCPESCAQGEEREDLNHEREERGGCLHLKLQRKKKGVNPLRRRGKSKRFGGILSS